MSEWNDFSIDEFDCTHCGENEMDELTIDKLQELRDVCPFPFIISSGYRCPHHPNEIKKIAPGPHQTGRAVDIVCSHTYALMLIAAAIEQDFFHGFGIAQRGNVDRRFLHFDWCIATPQRPRPHIWSY